MTEEAARVTDAATGVNAKPKPAAPYASGLRSSLHRTAYRLATDTQRHPAEINAEINRVIGVGNRDQATEDQLRNGLEYVHEQLNAAGHDLRNVTTTSVVERRNEILTELLAIAAQQATLAADTTVLLLELNELSRGRMPVVLPPF